MSNFLAQPVVKKQRTSNVHKQDNLAAVDFVRKAMQEEGFVSISSETNLVMTVGTTAQRSIVPVAGEFRFNSTLGFVEVYTGSAWVQASDNYSEYTVTLSNTNLKNLLATPINVLAAAGAGFYWDIREVRLTYNYAGAAFTNTNVTDLKIYDATTTQTLMLLDSALFTRVATTYAKFQQYKTYMVAPNSVIKVSVTGSAELLAGGTGTATVVVVAKKRAV